MFTDSVVLASLLTVGSVILVTAGILYYFMKEGEKRDKMH